MDAAVRQHVGVGALGPIELLPFITRDRFPTANRCMASCWRVLESERPGALAVFTSAAAAALFDVMLMVMWGASSLPLAMVGATTHSQSWRRRCSWSASADGVGVVIWGAAPAAAPTAMLGRVSSLTSSSRWPSCRSQFALAGPLSEFVPVEVHFAVAGIVPCDARLGVAMLVVARMRHDGLPTCSTETRHDALSCGSVPHFGLALRLPVKSLLECRAARSE